jgi:hypothetical protein
MSGSQASLIHNERTKLLATALNSLGVGAIIVGTVGPVVTGSHNDAVHVLLWLFFGADLIFFAQGFLGRLR